jgi:hypothetical protein
MPTLILSLFRFVRLLFSGHAAIAIENGALRVQLAAFQRKRKRPTLTSFDRLFWVGMFLLWTGWRAPLVYVRADTVVRWQRERLRRFWARRYESEPAPWRPTRDGLRDSTPHRTDGCRQLSLGRTQDSRRVEDAWHRDLRTHYLPNPPETAAAARPDVEDLPAQSPRSNGFD